MPAVYQPFLIQISSMMLVWLDPESDKMPNWLYLTLEQGVDTSGTETKGTVLIKSAEELQNYSTSEEKRIEEHIKVSTKLLRKFLTSGCMLWHMILYFPPSIQCTKWLAYRFHRHIAII